MIRNGFYYCTVNDAVYHKTDEGMDILIPSTGSESWGWCDCYDLKLSPITQKEISDGEMVFLGE